MSFLIAASAITCFESDSDCAHPDPDPTVLFLAGPANNAMARRDTAALAMRTGKDIVYLEFERGATSKGPKNVVVFEMNDGELTTWARCALWSRGQHQLTVIVPRGRDFAFGYDGIGIRRMTGVPTEDLVPGFAAAKAELMAIAGRMTPAVFDEIKTVATHIFPARDS